MDVAEILAELTRTTGLPPVLATDIEKYLASPITFWCDWHAPDNRRDSITPYQQHMFDSANEHRSLVMDSVYPGAAQRVFRGDREGLQLTLELMAQGEPAIKNMPLACGMMGLRGRPNLLLRSEAAESRLGPYCYQVVEIKAARNIQRGHLLQGAAYNRLVGAAQGYEPAEFYIRNRDGDVKIVPMAGVEQDLEDVLQEMREIIKGKAVDPCHGAAQWPWISYVNNLAITANDVSLIPGVGVSMRENLVNMGFGTVADLAEALEQSLTEVPRVGAATACRFITAAKAISQGHPVPRNKPQPIARATTEVFLDFEGTDPSFGDDNSLEVVNYLIGNVVRQGGSSPEFVPFFADSVAAEEANLREFLYWGRSLEDPTFYHWHHYEKTHLTKMVDHYGVSPEQAAPVLDHLTDLYPITTRAYAFPTYGESLKDIARYLGFNWRQEDVDALTSVALYYQYLESAGTDGVTRQKILDYNEDDCVATMHVLDWLTAAQR
ncbi:MAG: TM0106 family RecB-like putative nuclease [Dehalococcoidia bacterium]